MNIQVKYKLKHTRASDEILATKHFLEKSVLTSTIAI